MTNPPKFTHISDSASGNKGESMARETRFQTFAKNYYGFRRQWSPAETKQIADFAQAYALSESKGLASRVEELERGLRDIYECGSISYAEITIELLLAGAHAEEKE